MTDTDRIANARALIEPLTKLHDAATPGDLSTAEVTEEDEWFDCPHCSGVAEVRADQYINYDGVAANVLFSGIGHEFGANRDWYLAVCRDWPKVRDTVAALADLAEAQAQEIARLRDALKDIEKADFTACPFDSPDCQVKPDEPCPVCGDQNTWDQISQCKSMGASAAARAALGDRP